MDNLLTVAEVAERLGLNQSQVKRRIYDGKIKATKKGDIWLIDAQDIKDAEPHSGTGPKPKKSKALANK